MRAPTETDSREGEQSTRDTQEGKYQDSSTGNSKKQKWGDLLKEYQRISMTNAECVMYRAIKHK